MAIQRPLKEGSVTTYQQKVALGFPDILASEMDADLDTIYAAWNGGVDTPNLVNGSVTSAKLAGGAVRGTPSAGGTQREIAKASIWGGEDLIDVSVPTTKLAIGASTAVVGSVLLAAPVVATATEQNILSLTLPTYRGGTMVWWLSMSLALTYIDAAETWLYLDVFLNGSVQRGEFYRAKGTATMGGAIISCPVAFQEAATVPAFAHRFDVTTRLALGAGSWRFERGRLDVIGYA